tara:strand:+ start:577 stop:837 length:261 start_codon:yes stop_codon:yes gene_type:complete
MPIFDYKCPECETLMESKLVRRWDEEVPCESCGHITNKLPCAPSLQGLNTPEKIDAALKKRSLNHSRKNKDEALQNYAKQMGRLRK